MKTEKVTSNEITSSGAGRQPTRLREHIVEVVSDSGEGAQKCGRAFGTIAAKMGNGSWTVEIIPAEIQPPARSREGASGIRVRFGSELITNMGDCADVVVAFNEQVLYGRINQGAYRKGTIILLESKWGQDAQPEIRQMYAEALEECARRGFVVHQVPMHDGCLEYIEDPRRGKNMFALGLLCRLYTRDREKALGEVEAAFAYKGQAVVDLNQNLLMAGYRYAQEHLDYCWDIEPREVGKPLVVMNGNQAAGLGLMAAGVELVAMYPITPATSASHYLAEAYHRVGGFLHQAEDEIAAIAFAIGASYAGKTAATITSGPGLALKTECLGLASMAEVPVVVLVVQRGGPSTGLPTKVEQGDLLASLYGAPGDAPKVVIAPATISECFHFMITARKLAEAFRIPVIVLSDANLATGVQPFERPEIDPDWLAAPIDQSPWKDKVPAYDWDETTGISPRAIPGQRGGEYVLTGLAHDEKSHVAYAPDVNQAGHEARSRKLRALQGSLLSPKIHGADSGDLLIVGWGSTIGSIEEAVDRARAEGASVSSVHLRFLAPLEPGLAEIFARFDQVVTIELNYGDPPEDEGESRRRAQLAWLLRSHTLLDIDSWSVVHGQPIGPATVYNEIRRRLSQLDGDTACSA